VQAQKAAQQRSNALASAEVSCQTKNVKAMTMLVYWRLSAAPAVGEAAVRSPRARSRLDANATVYFSPSTVIFRYNIAGHKIISDVSRVSKSCRGINMKICQGLAK